MTLVDTSVWIDHFQRSNPALSRLLEQGEVAVHPMVLGELACGSLKGRGDTLHLLRNLPQIPACADDFVHDTITARAWYGRGIGWVDAHLLAACVLARCGLFTLDARLHRLALGAGCAYHGH